MKVLFSNLLIGFCLLFILQQTANAQQLVQSFIEANVDGSTFFGVSVSGAGDINHDEYDDIIVGASFYNNSTGCAYIFYGGSPMDNNADIILSGEATSNYFGNSVSSAGDVNYDGYDDVIVGAYGYNSNTGRAYIFYGGAAMDNSADVILTGEATSNYFGRSVASAGDVNNDNYADVIVGAERYSSSSGRAYIFYGSSSMDNTSDITLNSLVTSSLFGYSVSSAGDVNYDGYDDVIVGAYGCFSSTGQSYIFYGSSAMDNTVDVTLTGEATSNFFGYSVSSAGDVNNDNYDDVVVGAYRYNSDTGRAYIFFGGPDMDYTADITLTGEATTNFFGFSVSNAGDVNKDNYDDVIVGANRYNSDTGRAYIFYGGPAMDNTSDITLTGETTSNYFGCSVSSAGDINNDGYGDVITGAYRYNSNTGRAYVFYGAAAMDNNSDVILNGETTYNAFGYAVSNAGDVNNDNYDDIIVGAQGYNSSTGRAYIFYGDATMNNTADLVLTGEATSNYFGCSVSSAGNVNGDNYDDVIVGAYGYNSNTGRAYIFYGGSTMDNTADITLTGEATSNNFGNSVSHAGNVNGDSYSDVIVGAYGYNSNTGRAYVFYGGAIMDNNADLILTGEATSNYFGNSVSSAGNVNDDSYDDVIVGAIGYNSNTGRAYIFYGGAAMDNTADVTLTGEATSNNFGCSVSNAGNVNGDSYDDVIVGAERYNSYTGRAYIFYGDAAMGNTANVTLSGEATSSYFGHSVSNAGDVNNDSYDDVIAGAYMYNGGIGRVYIYSGGTSMDNTADIILTGETYSRFGNSVSAAGDINKDSYDDIIVGAYFYPTNGKAYIYSSLTTWTGAAGTTDWSTPLNWSNNQVPTTTTDISIPASLDVVISSSTSANCNNIILEAGATLSIVSDETNSGSLIFNGSYSGSNITYQRYIVGNQWHLLGSPLTGQTIGSFLLDGTNAIVEDGSGNYSMKNYIESSDNWSADYTSAISGDIDPGTAYAIKRSSDGVISLIGTPNNATVDIPITSNNNGWNLLSNPFTSAIAATENAVNGTDNLISANISLFDPSYASIYVWEENIADPTNTNNYRLINHTESDLAQNYLQVGQGFFVKSAVGGGNFTITPAMQSHQTSVPFKTEQNTWTSITLNASSNNAKASTRICYREDMSKGLDVGYDAGLLNSYPDFALYTQLVENNGIDFALQCLPDNFDELIVPVGLDAKAGELITFSASNTNLPEEYGIILEDKAKHAFTNLSNNNSYSVLLSGESTGTGRFYLHTSFKSTLGIGDTDLQKQFIVFAKAKDHQLIIRGEATANTFAKIYTINGKLLGNVQLMPSNENVLAFNQQAGIYLVQITNEKGSSVQKVYWVN